ncbi:hypothetical protein SDRG_05210 [Saprolegnia diclina VS20]|uniref:Uncharacterized protein n=1 Tax=Saprolegnia diclina (strain VS20) TaxID=1156394 RepID=T0QSE1_SAPDV|nr:hypothetical protein SDRG_05210 [Saprolegnia diclina VS20]EQC37616.1 hypothetical protein SDRG_05210 [Saprolegnia diclina VS20]|eukprot:XP_008609136.1 hypothetical protein SDRG_05210 [Saprolegnia diclina VS20]
MNAKVLRYCAFPGIRYVLYVFVSPDMQGPAPDLVPPIPIPGDTRIVLDSRRLLALPNDKALPGRFPAKLVLDLNPILEDASLENTE